MKNIWKWILGILVVVLIVGVVGAFALMWHSHMNFAYGNTPMMRNWDDGPMMRGNDGWNRSPMMGRGGFFPFFGVFGLLGGLAKLVIFGALLYGAYWLGRRNARVVVDAPAQPAPPPPPPASDADQSS